MGFHWIDLKERNGECIGHIKSLWVDEDFRHRGIGYRLKTTGEIWAKGKGASRLKTTVHANNAQMIAYNLRYGFKQCFIEMEKQI